MSSQTKDPTEPTGCAPVLVVSDVPAAIEWYERVLGFEAVFRYGDPVGYGAVCRGQVLIHLQAARETDRAMGASRVTIFVGDAYAVHARLEAAGVVIDVPPAARDYGLVDLMARDLDGNQLVFGSLIETDA